MLLEKKFPLTKKVFVLKESAVILSFSTGQFFVSLKQPLFQPAGFLDLGKAKKQKSLLPLNNKKLKKNELAYIGDDVIDIPILNEVGFSAVVRNANRKAKRYADYICRRNGGDGAVREVIDLIFKIQKKEQDAFSRYFDPSRYERL